FATQNRKDFYNLLDVYLDATFFPLLDPLSFKQEGHRLELEPAEDGKPRLVYKGVVFNEMKGAMSAPDQVMGRGLLNALYPDTTYAHNSGGEPAEIPRLTHADLVAFHRRPSNAYFFTYGDLPLAEHLAFIEAKVLQGVARIDPGTEVPPQPRWTAPRQAVRHYPLAPGEDPGRKYQACLAWLTADIRDSFEVLTLAVLEEILLGNDAAPLRRALIDSGLGTALSDASGFDGENRDTMFACGLKDVAADAPPVVEQVVLETLGRLAAEGIDPALIESAVHQIEFHRKEVTNTPYPYGLKLLLQFAGSWIHGGDPIRVLRLDDDLNRLRGEIARGGFFESRLKTGFLDNPHRVRFVLAPDPDLARREAEREAAELQACLAELSAADLERIRQDAETLRRRQETEEDDTCLPTLALSEIPPTVTGYDPADGMTGIPALCYPQPTSGIVYLSLAAGIGAIDARHLPLLPFFCYAASRIGTRLRDYAEMASRIDTYTGGVALAVQARTRFDEDRGCLPFVSLGAKCLVRNQEAMFEILSELLGAYDFSDIAHLKRMLLEFKAHQEAMVVHNGHRLALSLAARGFSDTAALNELWGGIHQLQTVKALCRDLTPAALEKLSGDLGEMAGRIFASANLRMALVGEETALQDGAGSALAGFHAALPRGTAAFGPAAPAAATSGQIHEGWHTATAVSFVASCFPTVRLGHPDAPVLSVIAKLLRALYLHREIREKGGAYGGFALYNPEDGLFGFGSYRDPQIVRTLKVYRGATDFLLQGRFDEEDVHEAVLQVASEIDKPDPPGPGARKAFFRRIVGLDDEARLAFKGALLAMTRDRVMEAAVRYFDPGRLRPSVAVIGNREGLEAANAAMAETPLILHAI
ncbi:MAG: insulinase family protein, partial [Deltaproteobacteria bacterium]|nr:insulinase family protein [Deltaproteobacteria bacterium]